jgi:hypothetical protein
VAWRQVHVDQRPGIADHHVAHQIAHALAIGRQTRFATRHIAGAECFLGFEDTRFEQGQKVIQFHQRVLHGRRREQQYKPFLQRIDELPVGRRTVLQVVRFIHDHEIVLL